MFYPWRKDGEDYQEFLQLQTAANIETEKKLKEQEDKAIKLQQQFDSMRSTRSGNPITDPKSAMRLPTCPPPKFSGANVDYIPWKKNLGGYDGKIIHGRGAANAVEIVNPSQNQQLDRALRHKNNGGLFDNEHQGHAEHVLRQEGGVGMEGAEEGGNTVRSMI